MYVTSFVWFCCAGAHFGSRRCEHLHWRGEQVGIHLISFFFQKPYPSFSFFVVPFILSSCFEHVPGLSFNATRIIYIYRVSPCRQAWFLGHPLQRWTSQGSPLGSKLPLESQSFASIQFGPIHCSHRVLIGNVVSAVCLSFSAMPSHDYCCVCCWITVTHALLYLPDCVRPYWILLITPFDWLMQLWLVFLEKLYHLVKYIL